jgi:hypothetical protein
MWVDLGGESREIRPALLTGAWGARCAEPLAAARRLCGLGEGLAGRPRLRCQQAFAACSVVETGAWDPGGPGGDPVSPDHGGVLPERRWGVWGSESPPHLKPLAAAHRLRAPALSSRPDQLAPSGGRAGQPRLSPPPSRARCDPPWAGLFGGVRLRPASMRRVWTLLLIHSTYSASHTHKMDDSNMLLLSLTAPYKVLGSVNCQTASLGRNGISAPGSIAIHPT